MTTPASTLPARPTWSELVMTAVERRVWPEWRAVVEAGAVFLLVYLPGLGRGFIKDDFAWMAGNQVGSIGDLLRLFTDAPDFYRPLVRLSFAGDWWLFGAEPLAYGLVNLALCVAAAVALRALAIALGMPRGAALLAAGLWAFNFHGIDMTVFWISGRTSLFATLLGLLAALAFVNGRRWPAAGWALAAMLSKEDAALLPFVLLVWAALPDPDSAGGARPAGGRFDPARALRAAWPLFAALAVYAAARTAAGAMTPFDAPDAYRFVLRPGAIFANAAAYFDRAATIAWGLVLVLSVTAWTIPRPTAQQRRWVLLGLVWMAGWMAVSVLLPVRSSLYAVTPAAGAALAGAAGVAALWDQVGRAARCRMVLATAVILAVAVPLHWTRHNEWVEWARLSTHVLDRLAPVVETLPPDGVILIADDRARQPNLDSAFGTHIETAVFVRTGRRQPVWIDPPPIDWRAAGLVAPPPERIAARFALQDGALVRLPAAP